MFVYINKFATIPLIAIFVCNYIIGSSFLDEFTYDKRIVKLYSNWLKGLNAKGFQYAHSSALGKEGTVDIEIIQEFFYPSIIYDFAF